VQGRWAAIMKVTSIDGDFSLSEINCEFNVEKIGVVDLVIIAWKTTANHHYKKVITPLLHEQTKILTLQNGLGSVDELACIFGADRVYGALCFIGVNRLSPGRIDHSAMAGPAKVGKFLPKHRDLNAVEKTELYKLVSFLSDGGIPCEVEEVLERAQWQKLVWNIPFNGLTISEGGVDVAVLFTIEGMEQRIRLIMREVLAISAALGHEIADRVIDRQIEKTKAMGNYRPSSMIDYVAGREVEVDAIWFEPMRRARELGVSVPEIESLLKEIQSLID